MTCILCGGDAEEGDRVVVTGIVSVDEVSGCENYAVDTGSLRGDGLHVPCLAIALGRLGVRQTWFKGSPGEPDRTPEEYAAILDEGAPKP